MLWWKIVSQREHSGRGITSLSNVHAETKVRVACYITLSGSMWIKEAWKWEVNLEEKFIKKETEEALKEINVNCRILRRWSMARKTTIRRRMGKNMENTKTLNEGKVRKL